MKKIPLFLFITVAFVITPLTALPAKKSGGESKSAKAGEIRENAPEKPDGKSAFDSLVEEIEAGLQMIYTEKMVSGGQGSYPAKLDAQPDGPCRSCFSGVLGDPVNDPRWTKKSSRYDFDDGSFKGGFTYEPGTGKLRR